MHNDILMLVTGDYTQVWAAFEKDTKSTLAVAAAILATTIVLRVLT